MVAQTSINGRPGALAGSLAAPRVALGLLAQPQPITRLNASSCLKKHAAQSSGKIEPIHAQGPSPKRREMKMVGALSAVMAGACGVLAAEAVSSGGVRGGLWGRAKMAGRRGRKRGMIKECRRGLQQGMSSSDV